MNIQQDYLNSEETLKSFYNYPIDDLDFEEIIKKKAFSMEKREILHKHLTKQYQQASPNTAVQKNIEKILLPNAYTITTGHQLCLFGGPMFTIYKILSVINLCEALTEHYVNYHFVPVFWIHTEDHDFEEINHYYPNFSEKKNYKGKFVGAVGNHILDETIADLCPKDFSENLKNAYKSGKTWKQAYFDFFHELFQDYGLVMLDADDAGLKSIFTPIVKDELQNEFSFSAIQNSNTHLRKLGYKTQIEPRNINLFYMDEEGRNRIEKNGNFYEVKNRQLQFTEAEIQQLAEEHPEKFSPNVCLRPLYQEMILPNLAYIGGWGELSYWLQLKGVFDAAGEAFPAVLPRFSATLWRKEEAEKWTSMGFTQKEITFSLSDLKKKRLLENWSRTSWEIQKEMLLQKIEGVQNYINRETPNLHRRTESFKKETIRFLEKSEKKLFRQIELRDKDAFDAIENIKHKVQPDGTVQERILNISAFPDFLASELIQIIKAACNPLDFEHKHIVLG